MSKKIPKHVWKKRAQVLKAAKNAFFPCPRCGGEGYVDREDWIVTEEDGSRVCFNCRGSGESKKGLTEPLKVRYAVAYRLVPLIEAGDFFRIMEIEDHEREGIYYPILEDVFERALNAAERVAGV
jgi:hypothetical protein